MHLVDGSGSFDQISGAVGYSPQIIIGLPGQSAILKSSAFIPIENGWQVKLDLSTQTVANAVGSVPSIEAVFALDVTGPDGGTQTYAQQQITIMNRIN